MFNLSRTFGKIFLLLLIGMLFFPAVNAWEIVSIDLSVDPNPIPCGGTAVVKASIKVAEGDTLPSYGRRIIRLMEDDGPDSHALDTDYLNLLNLHPGINHVEFTLKCQIKEAGCQLYGPAGNSDETGSYVFVWIPDTDDKSSKVYVKCKQVDTEGEASMKGSDTASVGSDTTATMSAEEIIENVSYANLVIIYDSQVFDVVHVDFINPILLTKYIEGFLTYSVNEAKNKIFFNLTDLIEPIILEGDLLNVNLRVKNDTDKVWKETFIRCSDESKFYNELSGEINVCTGGNHSIFITPDDSTEPVVNSELITFAQGAIVGQAGSITDDMDEYDNYLKVTLYNESNDIVSAAYVNPDGSFELGPFFWLSSELPSSIIVSNGLNLETSMEFTPSVSNHPYVDEYEENSGKPGETVNVSFFVQGRSDSSETYDVIITNSNNWDIEQTEYTLTLDSMEEKIVPVDITIPTSAQNGSINTITLSMVSQTSPDFSYSASVDLSVAGEYEEPDQKEEEGTPGFDIIVLIVAICIIIAFRRKKQV